MEQKLKKNKKLIWKRWKKNRNYLICFSYNKNYPSYILSFFDHETFFCSVFYFFLIFIFLSFFMVDLKKIFEKNPNKKKNENFQTFLVVSIISCFTSLLFLFFQLKIISICIIHNPFASQNAWFYKILPETSLQMEVLDIKNIVGKNTLPSMVTMNQNKNILPPIATVSQRFTQGSFHWIQRWPFQANSSVENTQYYAQGQAKVIVKSDKVEVLEHTKNIPDVVVFKAPHENILNQQSFISVTSYSGQQYIKELETQFAEIEKLPKSTEEHEAMKEVSKFFKSNIDFLTAESKKPINVFNQPLLEWDYGPCLDECQSIINSLGSKKPDYQFHEKVNQYILNNPHQYQAFTFSTIGNSNIPTSEEIDIYNRMIQNSGNKTFEIFRIINHHAIPKRQGNSPANNKKVNDISWGISSEIIESEGNQFSQFKLINSVAEEWMAYEYGERNDIQRAEYNFGLETMKAYNSMVKSTSTYETPITQGKILDHQYSLKTKDFLSQEKAIVQSFLTMNKYLIVTQYALNGVNQELENHTINASQHNLCSEKKAYLETQINQIKKKQAMLESLTKSIGFYQLKIVAKQMPGILLFYSYLKSSKQSAILILPMPRILAIYSSLTIFDSLAKKGYLKKKKK